jgi:hypothetical protein
MAQEETSHTPLFELSEYERAGREFFSDAQHALMRSRDGLYGMLRIEEVSDLPTQRVTLASDQVVEQAPMSIESVVVFEMDDVVLGRFDGICASMDAAAESGLASLMPQFYSQLSEICDAAGQSIDSGGRPIDHEVILEAIAAVEFDFDEEGNPKFPTIVMHPDTAEKLRALGPPTTEQDRKFEDMVEEKRRAYFAGRATRRLS